MITLHGNLPPKNNTVKFKFCTYVHMCNLNGHVYLLVIAVISLHLEFIFIFSHFCPFLHNCIRDYICQLMCVLI